MAGLKIGDVCILKHTKLTYRVFLITGSYDEYWWNATLIAVTYLLHSDLDETNSDEYLVSKAAKSINMDEIYGEVYIQENK